MNEEINQKLDELLKGQRESQFMMIGMVRNLPGDLKAVLLSALPTEQHLNLPAVPKQTEEDLAVEARIAQRKKYITREEVMDYRGYSVATFYRRQIQNKGTWVIKKYDGVLHYLKASV